MKYYVLITPDLDVGTGSLLPGQAMYSPIISTIEGEIEKYYPKSIAAGWFVVEVEL